MPGWILFAAVFLQLALVIVDRGWAQEKPPAPDLFLAIAEPIAVWRSGVKVRPLTNQPGRHTIHTYYLTCPESPDGTRVLFFVSTTPEGEHGDLVVLDRRTGREQVIARGIDTEDAHRAACQQWISGGKRVAYHDVKDGRWSVHVVDLDSLADRKLALDRQLCFGRVVDDLLPIYGCHWKPGAHRDLELLDAATGEIRTALSIAEVEGKYGPWLAKEFGGMPTSIFFPNLSPDGKRVFFKMAAAGRDGAANIYKSENASHRQGLLVYDLATRQPLFMAEKWAHPAWDFDSRRILERGHFFYDLDRGGQVVRLPGLPAMSNHPSVAPGGKLFVTDGRLSFTRLDEGLPFNNGLFYALNYAYVPLQQLNGYTLAVTTLPAGRYTLTVDGRGVGTYAAAQLAKGINIASATISAWQPGGPWDAQATLVKSLTEARHELQTAALLGTLTLNDHAAFRSLHSGIEPANQQLIDLQRRAAAPQPYRFVLKRAADNGE